MQYFSTFPLQWFLYAENAYVYYWRIQFSENEILVQFIQNDAQQTCRENFMCEYNFVTRGQIEILQCKNKLVPFITSIIMAGEMYRPTSPPPVRISWNLFPYISDDAASKSKIYIECLVQLLPYDKMQNYSWCEEGIIAQNSEFLQLPLAFIHFQPQYASCIHMLL